MSTSIRYWIRRREDGSMSHLVRVCNVDGGRLRGEFLSEHGQWHADNWVMSYLYDPLCGDEISPEEAEQVVRGPGHDWPAEAFAATQKSDRVPLRGAIHEAVHEALDSILDRTRSGWDNCPSCSHPGIGEGLRTEYFRMGQWNEDPAVYRYSMDPLLGDEISQRQAEAAVQELGYEWRADVPSSEGERDIS